MPDQRIAAADLGCPHHPQRAIEEQCGDPPVVGQPDQQAAEAARAQAFRWMQCGGHPVPGLPDQHRQQHVLDQHHGPGEGHAGAVRQVEDAADVGAADRHHRDRHQPAPPPAEEARLLVGDADQPDPGGFRGQQHIGEQPQPAPDTVDVGDRDDDQLGARPVGDAGGGEIPDRQEGAEREQLEQEPQHRIGQPPEQPECLATVRCIPRARLGLPGTALGGLGKHDRVDCSRPEPGGHDLRGGRQDRAAGQHGAGLRRGCERRILQRGRSGCRRSGLHQSGRLSQRRCASCQRRRRLSAGLFLLDLGHPGVASKGPQGASQCQQQQVFHRETDHHHGGAAPQRVQQRRPRVRVDHLAMQPAPGQRHVAEQRAEALALEHQYLLHGCRLRQHFGGQAVRRQADRLRLCGGGRGGRCGGRRGRLGCRMRGHDRRCGRPPIGHRHVPRRRLVEQCPQASLFRGGQGIEAAGAVAAWRGLIRSADLVRAPSLVRSLVSVLGDRGQCRRQQRLGGQDRGEQHHPHAAPALGQVLRRWQVATLASFHVRPPFSP